jgi:protein-S-isoprenylcysteine O-methyltransferase Ste14
MPEMDGYEAMRRLRARVGRTHVVPAIALTALRRPDDRRRALEAGYHEHIAKPVLPDRLIAVVARPVWTRPPPCGDDRVSDTMKLVDTLVGRACAGLVFLLSVLALALFGSAGSLGFWRAWAYLAVFGGCSLLITLYLIAFDRQLLAGRAKAGPVSEPRGRQKVIQALASALFLSMFIVAGLDARYGWSAVSNATSVAGEVLVALGFLVVFLVFRENSFTSAVVEVSRNQRVVTTGPYGVVRHPMYAGAALLVVATPPALGSWVAVPCAVLLMLAIVARMLDEERFLAAELRGYDEYRGRVRCRLVPFVW